MNQNKCADVNLISCFWCGESTGIAIGEKLVSCKNKYNTKSLFGGYEPCDKCKEKRAKGFTIIEVQDEPIAERQPAIQKQPDGSQIYPTENMWVVNSHYAKQVFGEENISFGLLYIDNETANQLGLYEVSNGEDNEPNS